MPRPRSLCASSRASVLFHRPSPSCHSPSRRVATINVRETHPVAARIGVSSGKRPTRVTGFSGSVGRSCSSCATRRGDPVPDVHVSWFTDDGGSFEPPESVDRSERPRRRGRGRSVTPAIHHGRAIAEGYVDAEFHRHRRTSMPELPLDVLPAAGLEGPMTARGKRCIRDFVANRPRVERQQSVFVSLRHIPTATRTFENPSIFESAQPDAMERWARGRDQPDLRTRHEGLLLRSRRPSTSPSGTRCGCIFRQVNEREYHSPKRRSGRRCALGAHRSRSPTRPNHEVISPTVVPPRMPTIG